MLHTHTHTHTRTRIEREKKKRKKKIALGWSRTRVNGLVAEYADSVATLMDGNERDRDARPTHRVELMADSKNSSSEEFSIF